MNMIKTAGGISAGFFFGGMIGNAIFNMASGRLTFVESNPRVFRPISTLVGGSLLAYAFNKIGWRNLSKHMFLGAGVAAFMEVFAPVFSTIAGALPIPGMGDYVQMQDYVQLADQQAVEAGLLGGGYQDYVQMQGVAGLPGFGDQAAVEAGII